MANRNQRHSEKAPAPDSNIELLEALSAALELASEVVKRIPQAEPGYFTEAREELLKALGRWDDDHSVPVCLGCGSPRLDWVEALALYRCQDCCAEEDRTGEARRAAIQGLNDECEPTRRRVA